MDSTGNAIGNDYGFENKTKWVLVELAPLTASGRNEIILAAQTKADLKRIANLLRIRLTAYRQYKIIRLEECEE